MAEYIEKRLAIDELTRIASESRGIKRRAMIRAANVVELLPSSPPVVPVQHGSAAMASERRLIDAASLETRLCELCDEFGTDYLFIDAIIYEIGMAPTIGGTDNGKAT